MAKSNIKENRKAEAEKRRKRKTLFIICGVVACCALVLVLVIVAQPKTLRIARAEGEALIVNETDIKGGLNHVSYDGPQDLLFWRDAQGVVQTAYDACEECYASGNAHYSLRGDELTCDYCQTKIPVSTLGAHSWGGCQPVAIPVDFRSDAEGTIVIPSDVLDLAEDVFAQWDAGNYEVSLADHAHTHEEESH